MMAIAVVLMAASDLPVTLSAVRLEAQEGRPVVRAVVSGPVRARVEGAGRDVVLVLAGARPADGLLLPEPVAEIQSLAVEQTQEGTRIRIRLERGVEYRLGQEAGMVSLLIGATAPDPSRRHASDVRDLYAKVLPPPPPSVGAPEVPSGPAGEGVPDPSAESEGLHFGRIRVAPSVAVSYIDADTAFLDTPLPVRDQYFQIEPRLACDLGTPTTGSRRFQVVYNPRFRLRSAFAELRHATHVLNASMDVPVGPTITVRAGHHYANGLLETTEVDPGREYFFRLTPFTRHQTTGELSLNSGGRLSFEVTGGRDSVRLVDQAGFFSHRTDTLAGTLNYELGSASRSYLRYQWDHVPPAAERPIIESRASSILVGLTGNVLPLVTGEFFAGYSRLSAPRGGSGGTSFSGIVLDARLRKEFTPSASLTLFGRRDTYPSGFEQNAFYVVTAGGVEANVGLPLSLVFRGGGGWQRNAYRVAAAGLAFPRRDDIVSWSAGVGRSLTRWSYLRADYRADRRDSNLPAFETNGRVLIVQVGLGYFGASPTGGGIR
jgi:hypothetical protein